MSIGRCLILVAALLASLPRCTTAPAGFSLGGPLPISQDSGLWVVTLLKGGAFGIHVDAGLIRSLDDGDATRDILFGGLIAESNDLMIVGFEAVTSLWKNNGIPLARLHFDLRGIRQPDGTYQGSWRLSDEQGLLIDEDLIIITRQ